MSDGSFTDDETSARVPDGWTFHRAAEIAHSQRVVKFDPKYDTRRLTLCQSLREIWLKADNSFDGKAANDIKLYVEVAFEIAKRIDKRQKELRRRLSET